MSADRFVIAGGTIHDPVHDRDGAVGDVWIDGGRIVAAPADPAGWRRGRSRRPRRSAR